MQIQDVQRRLDELNVTLDAHSILLAARHLKRGSPTERINRAILRRIRDIGITEGLHGVL